MAIINSISDSPDNDSKESLPTQNVSLIQLVVVTNIITKFENVFKGVKIENSLTWFVQHWVRVAIGNGTVSILRDECPLQIGPPAINMNIVKVDIVARVCGITSNDAWCQGTSL